MTRNWLDRLGDWNPQLFRELKGRLRPRNVMIATALSLVGQAVLFFMVMTNKSSYIDEVRGSVVDWPEFWAQLFISLNWMLPFLLIVPVVYMLIEDLGRENRRGTLNFVRLSPQSSRDILLGKLLGVPILVYLGVALIVPLYLWTAFNTKADPVFLLSYYGVLGAACACFFSVALLVAFLAGRSQLSLGVASLESGLALSSMAITGFMVVPAYLTWNIYTLWQPFTPYFQGYDSPYSGDPLHWFSLTLDPFLMGHGFALVNYALVTYGIWKSLDRCFYSASRTIVSKRQSYSIVAYLEILMLGFAVQAPTSPYSSYHFEALIVVSVVNMMIFAILMAALSPQRQELLDWARYRRESTKAENRQTLLKDLIWGERSPSVVAIALNLAIALACLVGWILFWPEGTEKLKPIAGLLLSSSLILIYATIAQMILFMKSSKRAAWTLLTLVALTIGFPIALAIISPSGASSAPSGIVAVLLLFSPFQWVALKEVSALTIALSILAEWAILAGLNLRLTRQLRKAGESESKALMSANASSLAK